MPTFEFPNEELHDSGSSLGSTPRRINQFLGGEDGLRRGRFLQRLISTDSSSIEIDLNMENFLNIERLHAEPQHAPIVLPEEPTFEELLKRVTGRDDIQNADNIKLRVISYMVSLQRLSIFMPKLITLNLEGSVIGSLRDLGCGLIELKYLNVTNCGLRSLDGTNGLSGLESLIADNNMIENVGPCCNLTELKVLSLKENKVKDMGIVSFLAMCPFLQELNFKDNPIALEHLYRQNIKRNIPTIEILDGSPFMKTTQDVINETIELSLSSTTSFESVSSLTSLENSDFGVAVSTYSHLPSTSQQAYRQIQAHWGLTLLATDSKTMSGTILNKARRHRRKMHSSQLSLSSTTSSGSCEIRFTERLPQNHVDLELGVIGNLEDDETSNISRVSIDSLQELMKKWKLECKRKKAKEGNS